MALVASVIFRISLESDWTSLIFHLFVANLYAPLGVNLVGGHGSPVPIPYALHEFHRADHADLNLLPKNNCPGRHRE